MSRIRKPWILSALRGETDYRRWSDTRNIHSQWESRTARAADFVPKGSRVIEFGAATRTLERHLDPSCSYVPSDIVDRGPGTLVCDMNERPLPDLGADSYDAAVLMGVLEYIHDVPAVVDWLGRHVGLIVVSYACSDAKPRVLRAVFGRLSRLSGGWMNNFRADEFRAAFTDRGWVCEHEEPWKDQRLFVFRRSTP